MATIDKRVRSRRDASGRVREVIVYRVRYHDSSNRRVSKSFPTSGEANDFRKRVEVAVLDGTYVSPKAGKVTFGEYALAWLELQMWAPATREHVNSVMKSELLPRFGSRQIASIRTTEIQAAVRVWSESRAAGTVVVRFRHLSAVFKSAVLEGLIASSPCVGVKVPRVSRKAWVSIKTEHVLALSDAIDPRFRAAIWIGAGAGLRGGEVLALTPERIEWLPGAIRVEAQIQTLVGREPFEKEPKNGSRRLVPVGEVVLEELSRHLESLGGPSYEGYLFTNRGKSVRRSRFMEVFKRAVVASGVPSGTTFHDLRHYYASLLIAGGENVKTVQARLGHASATETLNTYAHLWPNSDSGTRSVVDAELKLARELRASANECGPVVVPALGY